MGLLVGCKSGVDPNGEIPPAVQARSAKPGESGEPEARLIKVTKDIKMYDRLEIFVTEDPQFNGVYTVRESGDIIIPIVGRVPVEGFSVEEAEKTIKERLERGQLQKATVIVDRLLRWWWFNDNHNRGYGGYVGYGDHDFGNDRRGISNGLFGSNGKTNDQTSGGDEVSFFMTGKVSSPGQKTLPLVCPAWVITNQMKGKDRKE